METAAPHRASLRALLVLALVGAGCAPPTPAPTPGPAKASPALAVTVAPDAPTLEGIGSSASLVLQLTPANGFHGKVTLAVQDAASESYTGLSVSPATATVDGPGPTLVSAVLTQTGGIAPGHHAVRVVAMGTQASGSAPLDLQVISNPPPPTPGADFAFSAPQWLSGEVGGTLQVVFTVTPIGGFKGNVAITVQRPNPALALPETDVTVGAGSVAVLATLQVITATPGTVPVTFVAAGPGHTHTVTAQVSLAGIPAAVYTVAPGQLSIAAGSEGTVLVTTEGTYGYSGILTLAPSPPSTGFTVSPATLAVEAGVTRVTAVSIAIAAGVPAGTVYIPLGPAHDGDHTVEIRVTAPPPPNVALALSPDAMAVRPGQAATVTLALTSVGGYDGPVSLRLPLPAGVTLTSQVPPISVQPGPATILSLDLAFDASLAAGSTDVRFNAWPVGIPVSSTPTRVLTVHRVPDLVPVTSDLGHPVRLAVLGDVNEDGHLDLVIDDPAVPGVDVLLGQGDGTFVAAPQAFTLPETPADIALADVDGDGHLDLVTALGAAQVIRVFAGTGTATFAATGQDTVLHGQPTAVSLADLDRNGQLDLAVAETGPDQHEIGFGTPGQLGFTLAAAPVRDGGEPALGIAARATPTGGAVDVLLKSSATKYVLLETGVQLNATIGYGNAGLPTPGVPSSLTVVRLTGGGVERLVALPGLGRLDAWPGMNFPTAVRLGPSPVLVAGADLDGDGNLDLVGADADGSLQIRLGAPGAAWFPAVAGTGTTTPVAVRTGDLGGDARPDVLVVDASGRLQAFITQ